MVKLGCPFSVDASSPWIGKGGPGANTEFRLQNGTVVRRDDEGKINPEFVSRISNTPMTVAMTESGGGGSQF